MLRRRPELLHRKASSHLRWNQTRNLSLEHERDSVYSFPVGDTPVSGNHTLLSQKVTDSQLSTRFGSHLKLFSCYSIGQKPSESLNSGRS